jgi:hypothetical protein
MAQSSAPGSTTSAAAQPTEEEKKEFCVKLVGWTDATQKVYVLLYNLLIFFNFFLGCFN